jgi:tetratricopeptide (TPR) repeat protein
MNLTLFVPLCTLLLIGDLSPLCGRLAAASSAEPARVEADPILKAALAAEARFDSKLALELFQQADAQQPNRPFVLRKISRQYSDLTIDTNDPAEKKRLCLKALEYGQRAFDLQPESAVNALSLAICYGKLGLYSNIRTRIEQSRLIRQYAEQALRLNPDYDYAHHVLGRWHYEVSSLGAGTRFIVRLVYGGLPSASTAEAVRHLQKAVDLSPHLPAHRVELGFALLASGQRESARKAFEEALTMPQQEKHDIEALARAREALKSLQ